MRQTLTEPLHYLKIPYRVYSLGRGIKKVNKKTFLDFEWGRAPFPTPFFRTAAFALCSQSPLSLPVSIVLLGLDVDEKGFLERDSLITALYHLENKNFDNPYLYKGVGYGDGFMPQAYFELEIKKPLSDKGQQAMETIHRGVDHTLAENPSWEWEDLGIPMEGLAEILVRVKDKEYADAALKVMLTPSPTIITSLCSFLLHTKLSGKLLNQWLDILTTHTNNMRLDDDSIASCAVSLVSSKRTDKVQRVLNNLLHDKVATNMNTIATYSRYFGDRCIDPEPRTLLIDKIVSIENAHAAKCMILDLTEQTSTETIISKEAVATLSTSTRHKLRALFS